ncbi:MAG: FecR domain-containing protein [Lachnospiraceae bacterium]|nr:FecR domain-containing protein [Lachnospiraceae bacterium]
MDDNTSKNGSAGTEKDAGRKKKILLAVLAFIALVVLVLAFIFSQGITATTMRILRIEGTVLLKDGGKDATVRENLRLKSGNSLETKEASLVSIGLDDAKIVTLNENSLAEFRQKGRKLDLSLESGSLFFDVSRPLTDDEAFDIRTSTMVVGIRGTSGYVFAENGQEGLIISDGVVHVIGTNPTTGEVKEIDVHAGEKITVYLYNDRKVDSIEFRLESIIERQLSEFVLERLREDMVLLDKVVSETQWDKPWILGLVKDEPAAAENPTDEDGPDDTDPSGGGSGPRQQSDGKTEPDKASADASEETPAEPDASGSESGSDEAGGEDASSPDEDQYASAMKAVASKDPTTGILILNDGTVFDPGFYGTVYPDVSAQYGNDAMALLSHYLQYGRKEGRMTFLPTPTATPTPEPVPSWVWLNADKNKSDEPDPYSDDGGSEEKPKPVFRQH